MIEFGNWSKLQSIIPSTSTPVEVGINYQFQPNECAYIPQMTFVHSGGLQDNEIPTEANIVEAFRLQMIHDYNAKLLYCKLTMTKTQLGIQWGRIYYKIECNVENIVLQATTTLIAPLVIYAIVAILAISGFTLITLAVLTPSILYKIAGLSPEEVDAYNDAQVKLWEQLNKAIVNTAIVIGVAVVGLGIFTIYSGRQKVGEKK